MCGENKVPTKQGWQALGSPPHVRGKQSRLKQPRKIDGITPACAGKTTSGGVKGEEYRDHPRMCGEN